MPLVLKKSGISSSEKQGLPHVLMAMIKINTANKLIGRPVIAISKIVIYPVENTIALGGVATGSMKAKELATQAETMR